MSAGMQPGFTLGTHALRAAVAAALLVCGAPPVLARTGGSDEPPAGSEARGVVVLEASAPQELAPLGPGIAAWLGFELAAAGLEVREPAKLPSETGALLRSTRELWSEIARASGGAHLVAPTVTVAYGRAEVRLVFVEGGSAEIVASGHAAASLEKLGEALVEATHRLLGELEIAPGGKGAPAPRLSELAAYSRALVALRAGGLGRAFESLEGERSPVADDLRGRIVEASRARGVPVAEFARLAIAQGELDRAWLQLRGALKKGDDPALLLAAGGAAELRGDPAQAISAYEKAIALDPGRGEPHLRRAELLVESGDVEGARLAFDAAARLLPEEPRPLEALSELPGTAPERRAELLARAGDLRARRFEVDRAHAHFEEAIALDPERAGRAWRGLGSAHARVGRMQAASQSYERAIAMGEEDPLTWTTFGRIRRGLEDVLGAKSAFERALALDPGQAAAHRELGELYTETGRAAEAVPHLERAVSLAPDDAGARRAFARALHASGQSERALELLGAAPASRAQAVADLRAAARIHGERGAHDAARLSLEKAIELEPGSPGLREELARLHETRGDENAAASAREDALLLSSSHESGTEEAPAPAAGSRTFEGLVGSFPAAGGEGRVAFLGLERGWGGWRERLLEGVRPRVLDRQIVARELALALGERFELDPEPPAAPALDRDLAALRAFDAEPERIALVNDVLGSDALFVGRVSVAPSAPGEEAPVLLHVELHMLGGRHADEVALYANTATLVLDAKRLLKPNWSAIGLYVLGFLLLSLPVCRGWGSMLVHLDYAASGKGFFSIRVSRRPGKAKKGNASRGSRKHRFQQRLRSLGRFQRSMAGRETLFRWLPARSYHVAVHGLLEDQLTSEVIGNYFEERKVKIERGKRVELRFDFRPKEAPVQVQVWAGEQPAAQAIVAVRGHAPRYARDGKLVLALGKGTHVVRAGFDGRGCEKRIEIRELDGMTLAFSAYDEASRVFENCPEAVEPYLSFDDLAAADCLERASQKRAADRVRGQWHRDRGESEEAAACFEAAGQLEQAAQSVAPEAAERSATLFEKAGDFGRAAERYRAAGDIRRAAQAFEASYDLESAIECWREAGEPEKVLELLERQGNFFEAGELAMQQGASARAIRDLQQVDLRSPSHGRACELLAEILEKRGEFELAAQKLRDAVYASGGDDAPLELIARFAEIQERAANAQGALEAWEVVRRRDLNFPGVAARIQELRDRLRQPAPGEPAPEAPPVGPPAESRYEILGELGRGGMGVVLKARDRRLGRVVALKRLPENLRDHPTAVKLFLREAQAIAALNHPNIVTLFDADQDERGYFLTMEHLEGLPLHQLLRKHRRLVAKDAARIGVQVASGLQYAHERRIVHRDVKTANLFLTRERVVKIMDFGLAKVVEEVRRGSTVIGGTPYYMAPEQAAGEAVDHRADLYAFGVTLFELVAGSVPFPDGDVAYHHRRTPAPDLREKLAGVPDAFAELVRRLLAKRPEDRPATTAEVTRSLQEVATGG